MRKLFGIQKVLPVLLLLGSLTGSAHATESPPSGGLYAPKHEGEKLLFYFGSMNVRKGFQRFNDDCVDPKSNPDDRQIMHVATHTNAVMELGWGDWSSPKGRQNIADCMVKRLVEAQAFGIEVGIVSIDFLLWYPVLNGTDTAPHFYRGDDVIIPELRSFFRQLEANGVINMVKRGFCYLMDEPGLYGITGKDMERAVGVLQKVASEFEALQRCRTYVIYSYGAYPGIEFVDMVGHDHYEIGARIVEDSEFERFRRMLRPLGSASSQWMSVVPGGAFGQDPTPFLARLGNDPQVKALNAFIYFDGWNAGKLGIHGNGTGEKYCVAGKKFFNPTVAEPDCTSPPPQVSLSVNGEKHITVTPDEALCYRWSSTGANPKSSFTSYWSATNPSCAYGRNAGHWVADTAEGEFCWPADSAQAGCTYTITYAGCGEGKTCDADAISVRIKGSDEKK